MLFEKLRLLFLPLLLFTGLSFGHAEPINLNSVKQELTQYHDSGKYAQELNLVTLDAKKYITQRIKQNNQTNHPQKLAVIFDIDETTLSNYPAMKELNFGGTLQQLKNLCKKTLSPIAPALQLYQYLQQNKVAVFFVTGRQKPCQSATITNLKRAGYTNWDGLYFKPSNYHQSSVIPYKASIRKLISEEQGYVIIATIGDQQSDLEGGYAEKKFKLPNPYYYIP